MSDSIQNQIKRSLMEQARNFNLEELKKKEDKNDTVTLYHGTNTVYLNSILENGILPRNETGNTNWQEEAYSNENIVYLTNKWHYWYAYHSLNLLLEKKYGEDWSSIPEAQWWLNWNPLPIYFECKVPKIYLTVDEDIVYTKFVKDEIKKAMKKEKNLMLNVNWEHSLAYQGTVGVMGGIRKEWITSFTILGDPNFYLNLMGDNTPYKKEQQKWMHGKGKGKLKGKDLKLSEEKYKKNATIPIAALPKGLKISQFYYNSEEQSPAFILNTPLEYVQQPNQLEKI